MPEPITITQFREKAGPYFSAAVHKHRPLLIRRGESDRGLLIGEDEALAILGDRRFNPEVIRGEGSVSIWLPEFEIYGQGSSFADAKEDLLAEVRSYVEEYLDNVQEYLASPNRAGHLPYVLRAYLADLRGQLSEVMFAGPPASAKPSTALRNVPPA